MLIACPTAVVTVGSCVTVQRACVAVPPFPSRTPRAGAGQARRPVPAPRPERPLIPALGPSRLSARSGGPSSGDGAPPAVAGEDDGLDAVGGQELVQPVGERLWPSVTACGRARGGCGPRTVCKTLTGQSNPDLPTSTPPTRRSPLLILHRQGGGARAGHSRSNDNYGPYGERARRSGDRAAVISQ